MIPIESPKNRPASSVSLRRESSEASRGGKRRNSHQSAVFGEAGNGTVVGISELVGEGGFEPPKSKTTDLQSAPFDRSGIPPYEILELVDGLEPPTC